MSSELRFAEVATNSMNSLLSRPITAVSAMNWYLTLIILNMQRES
jgi:hypothetical protein